jgi:polysaccharide biosynthesis protein PelA
MRAWFLILGIVLMLGTSIGAGRADGVRPRSGLGQPEPRVIVVLHDGRTSWVRSDIHRMIEAPLNHLGWIVEPRDIRFGYPDLSKRTDVRGVMSWWRDNSVDNPQYWNWALDILAQGKRFVLLGHPGTVLAPAASGPAAQFLSRMGLAPDAGADCHGFGFKIVSKVPDVVEFERKLPTALHLDCGYRNVSDENDVYLSVRRGDTQLDLAIAGPAGGVVVEEALYFSGGRGGFRQWYLDPYLFLGEAFGTSGAPVPDTTTLNGLRLYFSHVNGDGWTRTTDVQPYKAQNRLAVDVLREEIFLPFADLPVTVGPVASEVDPSRCGNAEGERAARALFHLSNVEAAAELISGRSPRRTGSGQACPAIDAAGRADASEGAYDPAAQVEVSAGYFSAILPPEKDVAALLLGGSRTLSDADLRSVGASGFGNINGGVAGPMESLPSLAMLPPLGRRVEHDLQVYSPMGEAILASSYWEDGTFAFLRVARWLDMTEEPRRLKPVNLHYDLGSGETLRRLNALRAMLGHLNSMQLAPIPTSRYIGVVEGFFSVDISRLPDGSWSIANRGDLQTFRIDRPGGRVVDMERSRGVLGWSEHHGSLYVALDPAVATAKLRLEAQSADHRDIPILKSSRWTVRNLVRSDDGVRFETEGFGPGAMVWDVGAASRCPGQFRLRAMGGGRAIDLDLAPDTGGMLRFGLPASTGSLTVEFERQAESVSCEGGATQ